MPQFNALDVDNKHCVSAHALRKAVKKAEDKIKHYEDALKITQEQIDAKKKEIQVDMGENLTCMLGIRDAHEGNSGAQQRTKFFLCFDQSVKTSMAGLSESAKAEMVPLYRACEAIIVHLRAALNSTSRKLIFSLPATSRSSPGSKSLKQRFLSSRTSHTTHEPLSRGQARLQ